MNRRTRLLRRAPTGRRVPRGGPGARALAAAMLAALSIVMAVFAQSSAGFRLRRSVVGAGGGRTAASVSLRGTLGQPLTGASSGAGYRLQAGFWHPVGPGQPTLATATSQATPGSTPTVTATPAASATPGSARTWTVTSSDDTDDGGCTASHCSLREAIRAANDHSGPDVIAFQIPASDPGCDAHGVCQIRPAGALPPLLDSQTTIDGYSQPGARANSGTLEQPIDAVLRIVLDGAAAPVCCPAGLQIRSAGNLLRGLVIQRFHTGIEVIDARDNRIEGNFIGTDASGTQAAGNRCSGISVSGDQGGGGSTGNVIGGSSPEARNLVAANGCAGVEIGPRGQNRVQGNYIGSDASGTAPLANQGDGVYIFSDSQGSLIGGTGVEQPNVILFNGGNGIQVHGGAGPAIRNRLVRNRISGNGGQGIALTAGGNEELAAPVISSANASGAAGSACALCTVEVFSDNAAQGRFYEGSAIADATGHWSLSLGTLFRHVYVTATATDGQGNTSEFSAPFQVHGPPTITRTPGTGPTATTTGTAQPTAPATVALHMWLPAVRKEAP